MSGEHDFAPAGGTVAVVLNYRTPAETVNAVRALQSSYSAPAAVIVVDNASADGSAQLIGDSLSDVYLIRSDRNGGFSAGCNLGIRETLHQGASRILLLNPDVILAPDTLGTLERALGADPQLGIVGPVLVSRESPNTVESVGMSYNTRTGRMRHVGFGLRREAVATFDQRDVDGLSGCAMLIRREVFERAGLLVDDYFFGFEDLDFCLRARAIGFRSACIGGAVALHDGSASIGRRSSSRTYFGTRNHLLLASRHAGTEALVTRATRVAAILAFNLAHVLLRSEVPRLRGLRAFARGVTDHARGRYGPELDGG